MSQDKEREAFEAWFRHEHGGTPMRDAEVGFYVFPMTQAAWAAWQARAALASQQAVKGEPYAHIVELPAGEYAGTVKFFTAPSDPRGRPVYLHQPSPPSREPLTDKQIERLQTTDTFNGMHPDYLRECVREVERALGIHSRGEGEKA